VIIDWQATVPAAAAQPEAKWSPSIQLLRRVLMSMLADAGREVHPFADGPLVRACDLELVRAEFYRQYPADGTDKQKAAARQKAFVRAINAAQSRSLITTREVDRKQLVWLTTVEPNEATND
jgi:phosphatidylserine/phosphatidylglycerophosphate/cardiolipin synthase-like enzyme